MEGNAMKKFLVFLLSLGLCFTNLQCVHAQDSYRFLALGDSITLTPYCPPIWLNECGMGASTAEKDWVHQCKSELEKHYQSVQMDVKNVYWQTNPGMIKVDEAEVKEMSQLHPYDLVVIENTDQISSKEMLDQYQEHLSEFVSVIKQYNPQATIVFVTDFLADFNFRDMSIPEKSTQILNDVAQLYGCKVASLDRITKNPNYMNQIGGILYDKDGNPYTITREDVALHPNDHGMQYIAYKVLEQVGIAMDVGNSFADLTEPSIALKNGWITQGKEKYYYMNGTIIKGLYNIDNHYYCFDKDTGQLRTGLYIKKGTTYYMNDQGLLQLYKYKGHYYNQDTQMIAQSEGEKFEALWKVQEDLKKRHYKGKKKEQLKKCFQLVFKKTAKKKARHYTFGRTNPALLVNEYYNKALSADAKVCTFAYMAYALGFKKVTIALKKKRNYVKIGKTYYQPNSQKGFACKVKGPLKTIKALTAPKMTPVKMKAPTKIVKWDPQKMKLYYDNGNAVTGIAVYNNMFYAFDGQGNYDGVLTKMLRDQAIQNNPIGKMKRLIGEPLSTSYHTSCYGTGDDGLLVYKDFTISTFRSAQDGQEVYIAVKSNMQ